MPVTVVVADDRQALRQAVRGLLDRDSDIKIVGEAENFAQTMALMRELNPQVVVLDLHMPAPDDFSPGDLKRAAADAGSQLITMSIWQDEPSRALAASFGSFTLLDKSCLGTLLIPAIKRLVDP
jgi:DNA-binding NarL/FixJ family response regulator